jgi:phenylpropionate dioxygenase-like ring-hydroxylating dioxygenase large terminal subunit
MSTAALEGLMRTVRGAPHAPRALPAECYRDPDFFALEVEHVLRPGWHAVARWDDLPEPGDYASVDHLSEPLLLVRDESERLRVFSRVCRHRAHNVIEGTGNTGNFVCPYHRWSYGLDGELLGAPLMDGAPGFERERCGLPELRTDSWAGFVLVSLDPGAEPISEKLGALDHELNPYGMADLVTVGVLDFDSPWNWKVMVDNFMESYHHLGIHSESFQKTNPAKGTRYMAELKGPFSLLDNPGRSGAPDFYVGQVFPTLLFAVFDRVHSGAWYEMQIDAHDHFHLRIHMLGLPEHAADEAIAQGLLESATAIHLEDIPACEAVQRGLTSRLWEPGPLAPQEAALTHFYAYLAECLAGRAG